ncbi:hypothetical protein [Clostridium sp.]|uniref:hypothetical protein n=1 Tax=Clostridium sp. TaxID=1506 RepID=UPI002FC61CCE
MNKSNLITLSKCILIGILFSMLAAFAAVIINNIKNYALVDVVFFEGIVLLVIGVLSCIGGSNRGLFFRENYTSNVQFTTTDLEGNTKYERDNKLIKNILPLSVIKLSLIISGIILIISTFII